MITGTGIDIVHVKRMERWLANPGLLDRFFAEDELKCVMSRGKNTSLSLAARFAAKEAFGKALGTGLAGINLKDIMVINNHNGKPQIALKDSALAALEKSQSDKVHVSLTHESDNAVAIIILEKV
ncbi:MAG: holo-ACP synthase [Treponema sp.]|jgi:holo-[acyl-carrier protein] synthase|nr:holo-ACP synthase [Treponema sp.]